MDLLAPYSLLVDLSGKAPKYLQPSPDYLSHKGKHSAHQPALLDHSQYTAPPPNHSPENNSDITPSLDRNTAPESAMHCRSYSSRPRFPQRPEPWPAKSPHRSSRTPLPSRPD